MNSFEGIEKNICLILEVIGKAPISFTSKGSCIGVSIGDAFLNGFLQNDKMSFLQ